MIEIDPKFAGDDPFDIFRSWLAQAETSELNDPNAMALSTVDDRGLPNVRIVLLKDIEPDGFIFYTNYNSVKSSECITSGMAAFAIHWKSLRRQIRVRGTVSRAEGQKADDYYASRSLGSRLGAWASDQSKPLASRAELMGRVDAIKDEKGDDPSRPPFWGGFKIAPVEIEFWADGEHRLHDRFRWTRGKEDDAWFVTRLNP